jgi:hypothetical protein
MIALGQEGFPLAERLLYRLFGIGSDVRNAVTLSFTGLIRRVDSMEQSWNDTSGHLSEAALNWIRSKIEGLEFGDVKITVRQAKIVQIDREQKERHHEVIRNGRPERDTLERHVERSVS